MKYYTNVFNYGNQMLVRGVDEHGVRFSDKVEFSPSLFVKNAGTKKPTEFKTLWDEPVHLIKPGNIKLSREFIEKYSDVEGFSVYGNTNWAVQFISDTYPYEIKPDMDMIKVYTVDIETTTEYGFPDPQRAEEEVLLITVKNSFTKKITTFASKDYVPKKKNVEFVRCRDEFDLFSRFLQFWDKNSPDIITGWNVKFFDIPYLVNRISKILPDNSFKRLSPWGFVKEREAINNGQTVQMYMIGGVAVLDYLDLYKKFTYSNQESYKLDHIAFIELGENKLENPGDSFKEFYTNHWEVFVDYNIHDVELVDKLEDKMKLIELAIIVAYNAKVNFEDIFSQTRVWDSIIYNNLKEKNIVIPTKEHSDKDEKFEGAFVKDPIIGMHKWVASFDLNSLYPHLIMQYNLSPETLTNVRKKVSVNDLLNMTIDTSDLQENNLSMTANGWCYRKDKRGFLPELMEKMYKDRSMYKKQMLKVEQEYQNDKSQKHLLKEISRLNNLQMAMKIALNSAYGALGNQYFRYYDLRMAEGITTSGQLSIRWMANAFNKYMNSVLKTEDKDYVIAIDTDSIYLSLETLVEKTCANKTTEQKIAYMDKICDDVFQPFIDKTYSDLAQYMNAYEQKMIMKREVLADKGIWTAKKRYVLNVHNSEGVQYAQPKMKVMGLELVKSSTPMVVREKLREVVSLIFNTDEKHVQKFIADFKDEFFALAPESIAFPRSANNLDKYSDAITIYKKGTPIHVRGSLLYNHYCKKQGLDKQFTSVQNGDKIKFIYLSKPNPIREDVIAFTSELPKKLGLHKYVDYDLMFEKVFIDPVKIILNPIGWSTKEVATLDDFFI